MIRLLTDEHIDAAVVEGLRGLGLDVVRVVDVGLGGTPDPDILGWAAAEDRVLVTFDRQTVPGFAYDRVRAGQAMPGVIVVSSKLTVGRVIDEVHVAVACTTADEIRDAVVFVPL